MIVLEILLNLIHNWMVFKNFFITRIATLLLSILLSSATCLDFSPDDFPTILMWWLLQTSNILVIKMTFICEKSVYKIPKIFVSRNSIFSDASNVFLYAFSPQRYPFIPLIFIKSLVLFRLTFVKIYLV